MGVNVATCVVFKSGVFILKCVDFGVIDVTDACFGLVVGRDVDDSKFVVVLRLYAVVSLAGSLLVD